MIGMEAVGSSNLVIGWCVIAGAICCVLYDSGATHSFVSDACVKRLGCRCVSFWCPLRRRVWSENHLYVLDV